MEEDLSRITIVLDKQLKKKVVLHCTNNEMSIKDYLTNLIKKDLEN